MATGTVKWFNNEKGYGFIEPDNKGEDVFVHLSAVEKADLKTLTENQKIEYEVTTVNNKTSANNLKLVM